MRSIQAALTAIVLCFIAHTTVLAQNAQTTAAAPVPRVITHTGMFQPVDGQPPRAVETIILSLYAEPTDAAPLWQETQSVALDAKGRYAVVVGATSAEGIPASVLAAGALWLGTTFDRPGEVENPRVQLTSVPYSLRAADADTLGGHPASAYLLAPGAATGNGGMATTTGQALATGLETGAPTQNGMQPGTVNLLAKYVTAADVGNSAVFENAGRVGIGTAAPLDSLHVNFTDTTGVVTGYAVQNLGNTGASYSGMLFYDQNGALAQFQGFSNVTHEYRINNIASGGAINFMLGGASKFYVASTGKVRIGMPLFSSPSYQLFVVDPSNFGLRVQTQTAGGIVASFGAAGDFRIDANGVDGGRFVVKESGRIGIGMPQFGSPSYQLHVIDPSNTGFRVETINAGGTVASFGPNGDFRIDASGVLGGRFVVKESGRIGIGTAGPSFQLHVVDPSNTGLRVVTNTAGGTVASFGSNGDFEIDTPFTHGGRFVVKESGLVGIGMGFSSPFYQLHVRDPSNTGLRVETLTTGGTVASFGGVGDFRIDANGVDGGRFIITESGLTGIGTNTPGSKLDVNGVITVYVLGAAGATTLCRNASAQISACSSSLRYKTNVTPFHGGLSLIDRLRPIAFDWKTNGEADLGLAAEEVAEVEPLLVIHNESGEVEGVKYDRINVLLINAIKEQQAQITRQQQEIDTLIRRQSDLEALRALICGDHRTAAVCTSY
jgi:hypothetical protein